MSKKQVIPFHLPAYSRKETSAVQAALTSASKGAVGYEIARCETSLESFLKRPVLLTSSCTAALEMIAHMANIGPGDEVIMPTFTFPATATAFCSRGAVPIFADISPTTLNIEPDDIEKRITPKTKAIVAVHYAGIPCDMTRLSQIARRNKILLIEDNAHGLFSSFKGKPLGTWGDFAALSFHETKNFSAVQGGAVVFRNKKLLTRGRILRDNGTNRHSFFRGAVRRYEWVDHGSSYGISHLSAALLYVQLSRKKELQTLRRLQWAAYSEALMGWAKKNRIQLPAIPRYGETSWHIFYLVLETEVLRDSLKKHLTENGVQTAFHFTPLHQSKMGRRYAGYQRLPVAESISRRILRLPLYPSLTSRQQARVIRSLLSFGEAQGSSSR